MHAGRRCNRAGPTAAAGGGTGLSVEAGHHHRSWPAPGTGMDLLVRLYGERLAQALGKPVVVENKPGAGLMLGTAAVAAAPPDGYTLGILYRHADPRSTRCSTRR